MKTTDDTTTIYGYIERVTYINEETGFAVAKLQEKGKKGLTTVVGNILGLTPGEWLKLTGRWVRDNRYGEQFRVESSEITMPVTVDGLRKYLGSGMIKGIGPVLAERIVDRFGLATLEIIEREPLRLLETFGIGEKRVETIIRAWQEQKEIREVMIFLQGLGVSPGYSAKIYRQYGNRSIQVLKDDPYRLAKDIPGIGFVTADSIAQKIGIDPRSLQRAKAAVVHILSELCSEGHVFFPKMELVRKTAEMLKVEAGLVESALDALEKGREVYVEGSKGPQDNSSAVYLTPLLKAEKGVAEGLRKLTNSPSRARPIESEKAIDWVQRRLSIELGEEQKEAIRLAPCSKVLVITGGPGTGKTTIITAIVRIFQQLKLKVLLAAPTGRAAKRMTEATGWEARTIHRLLQYSPARKGFLKDQDDPLDADLIIIDEASMIDIVLMYHLIRAVPSNAHLVLVGDVDQLPSVGPGNVLRDIINSGAFNVVRLSRIFRQAEQSTIVVNAHRINRGDFPILRQFDKDGKFDFYFIEQEDPERILSQVVSLCAEQLPQRFGMHPLRDIQVITPMHKGIVGVSSLNQELQRRLNPTGIGITYGMRTFLIGDKVMQLVNNYEKDVFNGDIGWIADILPEDRQVVVDFDGRRVIYDYTDLEELVLAYAISVHKSQGSEYPAIVLPVITQHFLLLQRNLLYTAITRAKRLVVLIGTKKAIAIAIRNDKPQKRYTRLAERLSLPLREVEEKITF